MLVMLVLITSKRTNLVKTRLAFDIDRDKAMNLEFGLWFIVACKVLVTSPKSRTIGFDFLGFRAGLGWVN